MISIKKTSPGDNLPPTRQAAEELRMHFNAVACAHRVLDGEERVSTQQGRGTVSLDTPKANLSQEDRQREMK